MHTHATKEETAFFVEIREISETEQLNLTAATKVFVKFCSCSHAIIDHCEGVTIVWHEPNGTQWECNVRGCDCDEKQSGGCCVRHHRGLYDLSEQNLPFYMQFYV